MKTVLAVKVLLVLFKLITANGTGETSYHNNDDNVPCEIECTELKEISTEQDPDYIKIIDEFQQNISNRSISDKDAEFLKDVKIKYWRTDSSFKEVEFGNEIILKSSWMVGKPLKIIVHGWRYAKTGEPKSFSIKDINLVEIHLVRSSDIHVIGHSVGAHVAGTCGNVFLDVRKEKIDRITGLDPSSLGFKDSWFCLWRLSERLDKGDATFVDVIHTARGIQGISEPIGHVDFYPNNGYSPQPGCQGFNPCQALHCSHCRAYVFYSESINNPSSFESWKCNSMKDFNDKKCVKNVYNFMGHHANRNNHGKYYLKTKDKSPYGV